MHPRPHDLLNKNCLLSTFFNFPFVIPQNKIQKIHKTNHLGNKYHRYNYTFYN